MPNTLSLQKRLILMADVSDLMLYGCVRAYMPPSKPSAAVIYEKKERLVA